MNCPSPIKGALFFGVRFTLAQEKALVSDRRSPRWDLNPPAREEYDDDYHFGLGLRDYADRLIADSRSPTCVTGISDVGDEDLYPSRLDEYDLEEEDNDGTYIDDGTYTDWGS